MPKGAVSPAEAPLTPTSSLPFAMALLFVPIQAANAMLATTSTTAAIKDFMFFVIYRYILFSLYQC
jgi:hypothetical protein